ncbi:MAG: hypothetical protein GKR77_04965 [Legionellales bacterium]|nr:hypothetical protein [Legionellales bacterium]
MPTFFSLTPNQAVEYRHNLFTQIHEIVFHGQGGYDWHTVYGMPMWLRNFTYKKIVDHYEEKNKQNSGTSSNDLEKGRDILKQAQRNDPSNANQKKSTDKFKKTSPQINVPDFVTSKAKKV